MSHLNHSTFLKKIMAKIKADVKPITLQLPFSMGFPGYSGCLWPFWQKGNTLPLSNTCPSCLTLPEFAGRLPLQRTVPPKAPPQYTSVVALSNFIRSNGHNSAAQSTFLTNGEQTEHFNQRHFDEFYYPRQFFPQQKSKMREIVHMQAGQCGNQIGAKVSAIFLNNYFNFLVVK